MPRFLSYRALVERALPSPADVQWLAGRIAALAPFTDGCAVVCGSVSWGSHLWRSDIDVAHFSTLAHPRLEDAIASVTADFRARTGDAVTVPQVDIVVVGAEQARLARDRAGVSAGGLSAGQPPGGRAAGRAARRTFDDVAIRFADHVGCIAQLKGEPWRGFFDRYLAAVQRDAAARRDDIRAYVGAVGQAWAQQPLHPLERAADGSFTARQLDLLGHAENYPINLMRRMLAERACYPRPDRVADIVAAFDALAAPWAQRLREASQPFRRMNDAYEALVAECRHPVQPLPAADYHARLAALAESLPFAAVQEATWDYLEACA